MKVNRNLSITALRRTCNRRAPMQKWLLLICLAGWMQAYDDATSLALGAPSIQSLGAPPGFNDFTPTDVNGDGSVIVGTSLIPGDNFSFSARGFRWTGAGFQDLGSRSGDAVRTMTSARRGHVV